MKLYQNIPARFEANIFKFLHYFRIFDVSEVTNEEQYDTRN